MRRQRTELPKQTNYDQQSTKLHAKQMLKFAQQQVQPPLYKVSNRDLPMFAPIVKSPRSNLP